MINQILHTNCLELFGEMQAAGIKADCVIADPPFNIGYEYDQYNDKLEDEAYLEFSSRWIEAAFNASTESACLWLCIGDKYAAELKVLAKAWGWELRQWCLWHFSFGTNCQKMFTKSHTHILHLVKNQKKFTFVEDCPDLRVPSKRQLLYNDKRACATGRLPDDVWHYPRVAGTFKEREGFHGCQMPEKLIARMIYATTLQGDLVVDPFCGSGTTAAVCKKLDRKFITCDISENYVEHSQKRLESIEAGDTLAGADEMVVMRKKRSVQ